MSIHTALVKTEEQKISTEKAKDFISSGDYGAESIFIGRVRNKNSGKKVTAVTYDAHDQAVLKSFQSIESLSSFENSLFEIDLNFTEYPAFKKVGYYYELFVYYIVFPTKSFRNQLKPCQGPRKPITKQSKPCQIFTKSIKHL